jgi:hypothetical protein
MLMMNLHLSFAVQLIALSLGAALLIWSKMQESFGTALPKLIAYLVILFSIVNIGCTGYCAMKCWSQGCFDKPCPMMMMQKPIMAGQMMEDKNMPQQNMQNKMHMNQTSQGN